MKSSYRFLAAVTALCVSFVVGCSQAAPPAAPANPTQPAAQPQPTQAPQVAPFAMTPPASAKKADFPQAGKAISMIVPNAAGGTTDLTARLIAAQMEKDLGVPVQVLNKPGGGTQVGMAEVASAPPDGYTIAQGSFPTVNTAYMDPARAATYNRDSFIALGRTFADPIVIAVKSDSKYQSLKDVIDAARANPEQVTVAAAGILSAMDITLNLLEQETGVKFGHVYFDGGAPGVAALLGGHVEAISTVAAEVRPRMLSGEIRILALAERQQSPVLPGVPTMESLGYRVNMVSSHMQVAQAAMPAEIVEVLSQSIKKAVETEEVRSAAEKMGLAPQYLNVMQANAYWDELDAQIQPIAAATKAQKK